MRVCSVRQTEPGITGCDSGCAPDVVPPPAFQKADPDGRKRSAQPHAPAALLAVAASSTPSAVPALRLATTAAATPQNPHIAIPAPATARACLRQKPDTA